MNMHCGAKIKKITSHAVTQTTILSLVKTYKMIHLKEKKSLHLKMYHLLMFTNKFYRPATLLSLHQPKRVFGLGLKIDSTRIIYPGPIIQRKP